MKWHRRCTAMPKSEEKSKKRESEESVGTLKALIEAALSARSAYLSLAARETNDELKSLYGQYAEERSQFADELRRLGASYGLADYHPEEEPPPITDLEYDETENLKLY